MRSRSRRILLVKQFGCSYVYLGIPVSVCVSGKLRRISTTWSEHFKYFFAKRKKIDRFSLDSINIVSLVLLVFILVVW